MFFTKNNNINAIKGKTRYSNKRFNSKEHDVPEDYIIMFNTYTDEIVGGIAILTIFTIYYYMKKIQKRRKNRIENLTQIVTQTEKDDYEANDKASRQTKEKVKAQPRPKAKPVTKSTPQPTTNNSKLSGKEEGSFGEQENRKTPIKKTKRTAVIRTKRVVPPHDKIKKDDFQEFSGQRILVAEDNLINQKVIGGLLADSGIEIKIADDGQEALDILEKDSNFNIILMDAHMPRVDGFEATRIIRKNPAYNHIVVVALSGDTAADDIKKMTASGMEEHLEKPLRMDALYDILYAYTRNRESDGQRGSHSAESMLTTEIDTEKGLGICGYDEVFYNEILTEFIATYSHSHVIIRDLLNNKQMREADKYLLDISGITSNIGASNISEIALSLKDAVNNPKERRYVGYYKQYVASLRNLLKDIKEYQS